VLSLILNIIWLFFAGFWLAVGYAFAGFVLFFTVIGIPFGVQLLKLAGFAFWPFGRAVVPDPNASTPVSVVGNTLWFFLLGWWLALIHVVAGVAMVATIIGIPLGLALFKMSGLALFPFGRRVVDARSTVQLPPGSIIVRTA
jgi:uncharacterized membrane protein YccF (DUF307 family)